MRYRTALIALFLTAAAHAQAPTTSRYFEIHVVDADTGRGVPLVYLQTTAKTTHVTDSGGYVAFNEPGLMDAGDVWFEVKSYGYESPPGAFGFRGLKLQPNAGKSAEIKLKRINIAERLYRVTGLGIYRDSVLLGKETPLKEPLLNAKVAGQDTVQTAVYRGKYLWFWQDTDQIAFPLGCFSMTGATASGLPATIDPERGIDFQYFIEKPGDFARAMAHVPREGTNPIWIDGLVVTKDDKGQERMIGRYFAANSDFSPAEIGLVAYDDKAQRFERLREFSGDAAATLAPSGRPFRVRDGGRQYVCFTDGVRVLDTFAAASDPAAYEVFTCVNDAGDKVDRTGDGKLKWRWQRAGKRLDDKRIESLLKRGLLKAEELPEQFADVDSGKSVKRAGGSTAWNPYLKCWTSLFTQSGGDSMLGEIWFATASSPQGPWRAAKKVATHAMKHNDNSFYNPIQHENLARDGGQVIYFEGTFVTTFSGNEHPTPLYNYNNLMYRLDVADPRMKLPEPPAGLTQVEPVLE